MVESCWEDSKLWSCEVLQQPQHVIVSIVVNDNNN